RIGSMPAVVPAHPPAALARAPSEIGLLRRRQMIVEKIGVVLGANLFVGLLLHAPIASHSVPRLVEGSGSPTVKMTSIAWPPSTIRLRATTCSFSVRGR